MYKIKRQHSAVLLFLGFSLQQAHGGMIDKEGMAPWEICGLCHGLDGNSHMTKFPKLAGQKADYIKSQFIAFRNHSRDNDGGQMQAITQEVELKDLDAIALHFAAQPAPIPDSNQTVDAILYRQGKELYEQGRNGLPACVNCHNQQRTDTPWLDAQHQDYLEKQLGDFRKNARRNDPDAGMQSVAASLSAQELEALAHYLSGTSLRSPSNHTSAEAN